MDTIINYLETMFGNLPNTREVLKAKRELLQMMTDKYTELKAEGKTENEAVATVITEFGNINEIADDLGIDEVVNSTPNEVKRIVTLNEATDYVKDSGTAGIMCGAATALCITSLCGFIIFDDILPKRSFISAGVLGFLWMAIFITTAVALYIINGNRNAKWRFLEREACSIEYGTAKELQKMYDMHKTMRAIYISGGVLCCILSVFMSGFVDDIIKKHDFGGAAFFLFVAIGTFLFIRCGFITKAYDTLLSVNDRKTISGSFVDGQDDVSQLTGKAKDIMSVYWPTITCIYLCWSFLTFDWHISWLIWPIAAVLRAILIAILKKDTVSGTN